MKFHKTSCVHCRGRIEFPAHGVGEWITCPHCSETTVLRRRRPDALVKHLKQIGRIALILIRIPLVLSVGWAWVYYIRARYGDIVDLDGSWWSLLPACVIGLASLPGFVAALLVGFICTPWEHLWPSWWKGIKEERAEHKRMFGF